MKTLPRSLHYAWIIVFAGAVASAITSTLRLAFGIFLDPMEEVFGWSRGVASVTYAVQFLVFGASSVGLGRLSDRWGARPLMLAGAVVFTAAMILTAYVTALWQIYITYGVLLGLAGAAFFSPLHTMISRWFGSGVGVGLGLVVAAQGLGPVILAPLMRYLIAVMDWSQAFLWTGAVAGLVLIGVSALVYGKPQDRGLSPYGAPAGPAPGASTPESSTAADGRTEIARLMVRARRGRPFWLLPTVHFLGCVSHALPLVHVVPMATAAGVAPVIAAAGLGMASGFSVISRFGAAVLAEKFGGRRTLALTLTVQSLGILLLFGLDQPWMLYVFAVVFGIGYGGEMVVFPILNREYFDQRVIGSVYGYQILGAGGGMAAGGLLGGLLFDAIGNYQLAIWLSALLGVASVAAILALRPPAVEYASPPGSSSVTGPKKPAPSVQTS